MKDDIVSVSHYLVRLGHISAVSEIHSGKFSVSLSSGKEIEVNNANKMLSSLTEERKFLVEKWLEVFN